MTNATRHANYGQHWGEGAARCFSIEGDFLDDEIGPRLMPVPESFFCPISSAIMADPVATVDGCAYERDFIERWFRERRQFRQPITSPTTGLELPSTTLMPLMALQRAIEAYLIHRPEIKRDHLAGRSFEEAAQVLQIDLLEKQHLVTSVHDEVYRLREANRALKRTLRDTDSACRKVMAELERTRAMLPVEQQAADVAAGLRPTLLETVEWLQPEVDRTEHIPADWPHATSAGAQASSAVISSAHDAIAGARAALESHAGAGAVCDPQLEGPVPTLGSPASARIVCDPSPAAPVPRARSPTALRAKTEGRGRTSAFSAAASALPSAPNPSVSSAAAGGASSSPSSPSSASGSRGYGTPSVSSASASVSHGSAPPSPSASWQPQDDGRKPDCSPKVSFSANTRTHQFLQGALLVSLMALCFFLQLRSPLSPQVPLHGGALQGRAEWDRVNLTKMVSRQVEKLQYGTAEDRSTAAEVLRNIASESEEGQAVMLRVGATEHLVKLLEDDGVWVQEASASALAVLAYSGPEGQAAVARAGAISSLVQLLRAGNANVVPKAAASVLRHLAAGNEKNQVTIVRAGAIAPLVEIMRSNGSGARLEAAAALRQLAGEGREENSYGKQVAIVQAGAIVPLVRLLSDEAPGSRQAAAGTLRSLATNNADNQVAIAQAGAIGPLIDLLADAEPGARQEAAAALDSLTSEEGDPNFGNQVAIAQAGAIVELARLLQDSVPDVAFAAASALCSLAVGNADNLVRVEQAGAIPGLVTLLKLNKVAVAAISLLCSLASSSADNQVAITQAGAIAPLVGLLKHEAPQVRGEVARTLSSLASGSTDIEAAIVQASMKAGVSSEILKGERH